MNEPNPTPQKPNGTRQSNRGNTPGRKAVYSQAIDLQELVKKLAEDPKTPIRDVSALVRAWDVLEERKRILRGVPLPGQLRPDLDPVQLARTVKRMKQRRIIDVPGAGKLAIGDWTEADDDGLPTLTPTPEPEKAPSPTPTPELNGPTETDEPTELDAEPEPEPGPDPEPGET